MEREWPVSTKRIIKNKKHKLHSLNFDNSQQKSNDGMFLEGLFATSMAACSHVGGIQGARIAPFFEGLLFNLCGGLLKSFADIDLLEECLGNVKIPYLSPPNRTW